MDYSRPERADRLAAEYVLGTLQGPARRRFESLLPAHPQLRWSVTQWQQHLQPLATGVNPVQPPADMWSRIEKRLFVPASASAPAPVQAAGAALAWWQSLGLWRGLTGLATTAAVAMMVVSTQLPPPQAPIMVVLGANPDAPQLLNTSAGASFVASVSADGRALVLRPLNDLSMPLGRALELWAVPAQGAPRSLGLVNDKSTTTLLKPELLRNTAAFAVSVEPSGGSPTGAPTGPIVSVGKLQT